MQKMKSNVEEEIIIIENDTEEEIIVIENDIEYIPPITQEKTIEASLSTQIVVPDKDYTGLSKVTVKGYVANMGQKIITSNGTYKAEDDDLDGYSEVEVKTDGVNINDYFTTKITTTNYDNFGKNNFIKQVPEINIDNNVTTLSRAFINTPLIKEIQLTGETQLLKNMSYIFNSCEDLKKIKLNIDTSNVTNLSYAFQGCKNLIEFPQMNTQNVFNMFFMCRSCEKLVTVPKLKADSVTNISASFQWCYNLTNLGGFENLGEAYSTSSNANNDNYQLYLPFEKLTHESLMNVINNLYDIKTKGCNAQQLVLGSTNIAKLTSEEIAIATEKGWTVS